MKAPIPTTPPALDIVPHDGDALLVIRRWNEPRRPGKWSIWDVASFTDGTSEAQARKQYAKWGFGSYLTDPDMHVCYVTLPRHVERVAALGAGGVL